MRLIWLQLGDDQASPVGVDGGVESINVVVLATFEKAEVLAGWFRNAATR